MKHGVLILLAMTAGAQTIRVNPSGVNVNAQAGTSVFLSYGAVGVFEPAEAFWCGALRPAAPALGMECDPLTVFGALPLRYNQARRPNGALFTDVMSIPPSVARRAYQAAMDGADPNFYYVRRFMNPQGGPDQYVAVTCRLAGGGARVPFSLTSVRILFEGGEPLQFVEAGRKPSRLQAEIEFNGTGRLRGRWEVVFPGDSPPTDEDLLTEGSLPVYDRGRQRRYTQVGRFNVFLPPTGRYVLPGPDPMTLPAATAGQYMILLRVEASADKETDNSLAAIGAGPGVVTHGAVAGFPMPVLRYFVGAELGDGPGGGQVALVTQAGGRTPDPNGALVLRWSEQRGASLSRVELGAGVGGIVWVALLPPGFRIYRPPPWISKSTQPLRWRVVALNEHGGTLAETPWQDLTPPDAN